MDVYPRRCSELKELTQIFGPWALCGFLDKGKPVVRRGRKAMGLIVRSPGRRKVLIKGGSAMSGPLPLDHSCARCLRFIITQIGLCAPPRPITQPVSATTGLNIEPFCTQRRGTVVVLAAFLLIPIFAFLALSLDIGLIRLRKTELQVAADAASLAAVMLLPEQTAAVSTAQQYAAYNLTGDVKAVAASDVLLGTWNPETRVFSAGTAPINAVKVTVQNSQANGNPLPLFFARTLGKVQQDVSASAIALKPSMGTRFLIDNEMIDTDVPEIQKLATSLGITPSELLSDADGDWFIDLPPDAELELPTGQLGDEALFDINHPSFPFNGSSYPSLTDFMNYNEDSSSWRYYLVPKHMLDPLAGVKTVSDANYYQNYVNPDYVHVSPVYMSDINELNPVGGDPTVNALGLRRGLLAFKILGVGSDPDGPGGSVLPNLIIKIVDPALVSLNELQVSSIGPHLAQ